MKNVKVFQYWDKGIGNMPEMIRYIYDHNLALSKHYGFELIVIDTKNINDHIQPIDGFFALPGNFQSDIVRFFALHRYGGIWLDSDVVIINDLGEYFAEFSKTNYDIMLDVELEEIVGSASLLAKKDTICTNFCVQYIKKKQKSILVWPSRSLLTRLKLKLNLTNFSNRPLKWGDLGPENVKKLRRNYPDRVQINTIQKTSKGCNFINWQDTHAFDTSKWLLKDRYPAQEKAQEIFQNTPYVMTWTIYKRNNFTGSAVDLVFNDELSVFHHLVKISLDKIS